MHRYSLGKNTPTIALLILMVVWASLGMTDAYGPETSTKSLDQLKSEIVGSLDLGNSEVEQTAVTIAKDYPGEYNLNQVSEVYDALRKGWYYYSDPSYKDKYKHANRTLQDGKISNSIGTGDCDDFAILMASLLESLQGSTRIVFAYDLDSRKNHAYAEIYLGKKSDPRVDELINWLKDEYNQTEIPGRAIADDEVWLSLDYNSTHPGGRYFGGGHKVVTEVVWKSASRNSPKIVPIIDTMDSTAGWETITIGDEKGSNVSISSVPSPKEKAIKMDFNLNNGEQVGISRNISGSILSQVKGLNFTYYGPEKQIIIKLILNYSDGTSFGYSWKLQPGDKWTGLEALFEDFTRAGPVASSDAADQRLNPNKVEKLEIICQLDEKKSRGVGQIIIDHIQGVTNIPPGSPWARAEEQREMVTAKGLAYESEQARDIPLKFIGSVKLAIESLSHQDTLEGNQALQRSLVLLPGFVAQLQDNDSTSVIAFSHDGLKLATTDFGNQTVKIWEVKTWSKQQEIKQNYVKSIEFSPNDLMLATAGYGGSACIWDVDTGEELNCFDNPCDTAFSVAFSPDGLKLATGSSDNTARIWDVTNGTELQRLEHGSEVWSVAFSPDGSKLATGSSDKTARIWDVETGEEMQRLKHGSQVSSVAFSPDGLKLATGSSDNTARIWVVETGEEMQRLEHGSQVSSVAFSPDGLKLATSSGENTARIWDVASGVELQILIHNLSVSSIAFSPDGQMVATACGEKNFRIWDVTDRLELQRFNHDGEVNCVIFSPNERKLATASDDNTARIWDTDTGNQLQRLEHVGWVLDIAFSLDGRTVATASYDHTARLWDIVTGTELRRFNHDHPVNSVTFSHDGLKLATTSYHELVEMAQIWDVETGGELYKFNYDDISSVAFSPDGTKVATAGSDNTARIWDIKTWAELHKLNHDNDVNSIAFSPDGSMLATASSDNTSRIWEVDNGEELHKLVHDNVVNSVAFSPDGTKVATGSDDGKARIWDVDTWEELHELNNGPDVYSMSFSPDGLKLVTLNDWDNIVHIWGVETGAELQEINPKDYHNIHSVAFSPDSLKLATAGYDIPVGTARIWTLRSQDLICEACRRLGCSLVSPEWREEYCSKCNESNSYSAE